MASSDRFIEFKEEVSMWYKLIVICTCFQFTLFAQDGTFSRYEAQDLAAILKNPPDQRWVVYDSLMKVNQPNAAQSLLWSILEKGTAENNTYNTVRAMNSFVQTIAPMEAQEKAELLFQLDSISRQLPEPSQALSRMVVLNQLLYAERRWIAYAGVTELMVVDNDTVKVYDAYSKAKFVFKRVAELKAALKANQGHSFAPYFDIFGVEKKDAELYPTVFDYVSHQIIGFYGHTNYQYYYFTANAGLPSTDTESWFSIPTKFIAFDLGDETLETLPLRMYQALEAFHLRDTSRLSKLHYARLQLLMNNFGTTNAAEIWQTAYDYYGENSARSRFLYEVARVKHAEGLEYDFTNNPQSENKMVEANQLLSAELKVHPTNDFSELMVLLMELIAKPVASFQQQNLVFPGEPIPFKITHKNLSQLKLQIYSKPLDLTGNMSLQDYIATRTAKLVREQVIDVVDKKDFNFRSTELLLEGIEKAGDYFILLTPPDQDAYTKSLVDSVWNEMPKNLQTFTVTEIFVSTKKTGDKLDFLVTDYKTGKPISGAKVEVFFEKVVNILPNVPNRSGKTNKDGWYSTTADNRTIYYVVSYNESRLSSNEYIYRYGNGDDTQAEIEILTDRAIYRPGQTVHYKVISYKGKKNDFQVNANVPVVISLKNASWQEVYTATVTTNDFGSANGTIVLPLGGPLGVFYMETRFEKGRDTYMKQRHPIVVEEYKRPTFETVLNMPEKEAKLDDSVRVVGNAKAYAGYPISNATVRYRIYRQWNNYWRYYGGGGGSNDLIADSTMLTDDQGNYTINFFAHTAATAPEHAQYTYEIIAEVTDVSGETHETTLGLNLSKTGLTLNYSGPTKFVTIEPAKAIYQVLNLSGKKQEGFKGEMKIYQLKETPYFQERLWSDAEFQYFDAKKWDKLFPYAVSKGHVVKEKEELIKTTSFNMGDTLDLMQLLGNLQGDFRLEAFSVTSSGDTLRSEQQLTVIDVKATDLPQPTDLWTFVSHSTRKVGQAVELQVGSSFENAMAYVQLIRGEKVIQESWLDLKKRQSLCYTITEEDRGNIHFSVVMTYDGKRYEETRGVTVPFDNKELEIKAKTFRDKMQPGDKETWEFAVSGKDADAIAAEVCAGLYDASLDQFASHYWNLWPYRSNYYYPDWNSAEDLRLNYANGQGTWWDNSYQWNRLERAFRGNEFQNTYLGYRNYPLADMYTEETEGLVYSYSDERELQEISVSDRKSGRTITRQDIAKMPVRSAEGVASTVGGVDANAEDQDKEFESEQMNIPVQIRANFNETAFFYPDLKTNNKGEFVVSFTLPESLTEWKFMALAHTKDMKAGQLGLTTVAQKPLMVTSNAPRFFREGDQFDFSSKVVNLTDEEQTVEVELMFFNPMTDAPLQLIGRQPQTKMVTIPAKGSSEVTWNLNLSNQTGMIAYKITAKNSEFSDGEQKPIPVLTNRQLVTEALPFVVVDKGETKISFEPLKNTTSTTLKHESFTFEYTANPAWNAVLALPYLAEYPYECAEQLFSRYYANALAKDVVTKKPKIQALFETWKALTPDVFMSQLEKNEALKTILLEETPWILKAKSESERRRRLGELFEINQLARSQERSLSQLKQKQNSDGGFGWFGGNRSNVYITQHIVVGFGHLKNLGIELPADAADMVNAAVSFLNRYHIEEFEKLTDKQKKKIGITSIELHWLYATTYFSVSESEKLKEVKAFYHEKLQENWASFSLQQQALAGIYFLSKKDEKYKNIILSSLRDRAKNAALKGMYFPENRGGYYWDQDRIGTQALIIEFFVQAEAKTEEIDALRLWLLLQKRSNAWESTKSTALATYAILLKGSDYLSDNNLPTIKVGSKTLVYTTATKTNERQVEVTEGLGHFQTKWSGEEVTKELANITIDKPTNTPSYGAVYWQYFENMSKVKGSSNPEISIKKSYRRVMPGDKGDVFKADSVFKIGESVSIELTITVANDLEFVHIKDLRPAGFEPKMAISQHNWDQGLWYYQSPRDVSMNYFVDRLPKGTYTLTYDVFVTSSGQFDSGNAIVQCMYAPEFVAHSGGDVIRVER